MALLTSLPLPAARELARGFGLQLVAVTPLQAGSVNSNFRFDVLGGERYFARLYEEQGTDGAERELELLQALAHGGVPVALPLVPSSARLPVHEGKPFAIFPWVDGEILCQGRVTAEHCYAVGEALARVHLAGFDARRLGPGRFNPSELLARLQRSAAEIEAHGLSADVASVRELITAYVAKRDSTLPTGVVHGDLFRDNVLWSEGKLLALLDFESAFHGPLAYDLAVTLEAWCYSDAFQPELVSAMASGYASQRRFEQRELDGFEVEAAIGCLRFAATRITDFSLRTPRGTPPVRDFRRFLRRLSEIEAGALQPALKALVAPHLA